MDPVAHTLVGATLARTSLARGVPLALPTLLVAANLPDIDIATYLAGPDTGLLCRRGWTHGVVGLLALPLLLTGAILALDRWRRRRSPDRTPVPPRAVLGLAVLGVATHPALDWLNTYGVRLLMPLDSAWFYGDALFIVDPWVWLLLGGALFLCTSRRWRTLGPWMLFGAIAAALVLGTGAVGQPVVTLWCVALGAVAALRLLRLQPTGRRAEERLTTGALAVLVLYVSLALVSSRAAEAVSRPEIERLGVGPVADVLLNPHPGNPLRWRVLVDTSEHYHFFDFDWLRRPRLTSDGPAIERTAAASVVLAARRAPAVRGHVNWVRFPYYEIVRAPHGYTVYILDARYTRRRTTGFGGAVVHLDHDLEPLPGP